MGVMMNDKIYVGNGKEKKFTGGGSIIAISLDLEALVREYNNHCFETASGKKMIKVNVGTRREVGIYGDTHVVTQDTWHPDSFNIPQPVHLVMGKADNVKNEIGENDEIPF